MKSHLIMNCVIMCAFACPVMITPAFAEPFPDVSPALEAKNTELFEPIVRFIKEHPEKVSADEFYLYAGNYVIWITNGPDDIHVRMVDETRNLPPLIMTWRMQRRIWDAYKEWLPNYKAPEKEYHHELPR